MSNRRRIYWITQVVGWSLWLFNDLVGYILSDPAQAYFWLSSFLMNLVLCIALTHQYRRIIQQDDWQYESYERTVMRIGIATVLMTVIVAIVNYFIDSNAIEEAPTGFFPLLTIFLFWAKPMVLWLVFYHVYHYFEKTQQIEIEKVKLESSIKETESKVLRAQLNPHFMFNALNSIRALILEDPEKAQKGVTQLSNIFRSSLLADRRRTVSFGEEMRTVDDYLALEKIRYEERLDIRKNIYPDTLNVQVPPMMIQTLVENAIKHGVSKPVKGGFVSIEAKILNAKLEIRISNTGMLESTEAKSAESGFGLVNTAHRLHLLFGSGASFKIYQASKEVVCAEVLVPLELL